MFTRKQPHLFESLGFRIYVDRESHAFELAGVVRTQLRKEPPRDIDFSIVGTRVLPGMTPGLLYAIFTEFEAAGFNPIGLVTYDGHVYATDASIPRLELGDLTPTKRDAMTAFQGVMQAYDLRERERMYEAFSFEQFSAGIPLLTPHILGKIFEYYRDRGFVPESLTELHQVEDVDIGIAETMNVPHPLPYYGHPGTSDRADHSTSLQPSERFVPPFLAAGGGGISVEAGGAGYRGEGVGGQIRLAGGQGGGRSSTEMPAVMRRRNEVAA